MIESNVCLRKMRTEDIHLVEQWLNKDHIKKWFGDPQEWLEEINNFDGKYSWIVHYVVVYDEVPIGFCQYYDISRTGKGFAWDHEPIGTYGIDYLIGDERFLGKGFGSRIINKINEVVINNEGPVQLIADPIQENIASIRVLEKNGYIHDTETGLYKLSIK
ncbi:Aminoglycoside N(6')-acetyltransferase type 1 [compost metagenome]